MNTAAAPTKSEYPSRVDAWLVAALVGAPVAILVGGIMLLRHSVVAGVVALLVGMTVGAVVTVLSYPCVYTLTDANLNIRAGWLQDEIPLRQVRGAEKIVSLWSAPALSIRRVKVQLLDGTRTISPRDRDGFIADLRARLMRNRTVV